MRFPRLVVLAFAAGCAVDETKSDSQSSPRRGGPGLRRGLRPARRARARRQLPARDQGTTFKPWDFDPNLPAQKFRHVIQLSGDQGAGRAARGALFAPRAADASAVRWGGQIHHYDCGYPTDIYPCRPNGGNCTWRAWKIPTTILGLLFLRKRAARGAS